MSKIIEDINRVEIQLTTTCNSNCIYCGYKNVNRGKPISMDFTKIKSIIDQLPKLENLCLEGGEVTLPHARKVLLKVIEYARSKNIPWIQVNTNLHLLNHEYFEELKSAGLVMLNVSYDAMDLPTWLKLRGFKDNKNSRKVFYKFYENLIYVLSNRDELIINPEQTVTSLNYKQMIDQYHFIKGMGSSLFGIQFLLAHPQESYQLLPPPEELKEILLKLFDQLEPTTKARICCWYLTPCSYKELYLHPNQDCIIWVPCTCGRTWVHITAKGEAKPCGFWHDKYVAGNVFKEKLADILQKPLFQDLRTKGPEKCRNCKDFHLGLQCNNTCPGISWSNYENLEHLAHPILLEKAKRN
jgi:MoaA/NifB/PqqE/SkfB family radical SAM enzyme